MSNLICCDLCLSARATNPLNKEEDWDFIMAFCDQINKELEGPQIAVRLLAHKIQSPQEKEALFALSVSRMRIAMYFNKNNSLLFVSRFILLGSPEFFVIGWVTFWLFLLNILFPYSHFIQTNLFNSTPLVVSHGKISKKIKSNHSDLEVYNWDVIWIVYICVCVCVCVVYNLKSTWMIGYSFRSVGMCLQNVRLEICNKTEM